MKIGCAWVMLSSPLIHYGNQLAFDRHFWLTDTQSDHRPESVVPGELASEQWVWTINAIAPWLERSDRWTQACPSPAENAMNVRCDQFLNRSSIFSTNSIWIVAAQRLMSGQATWWCLALRGDSSCRQTPLLQSPLAQAFNSSLTTTACKILILD